MHPALTYYYYNNSIQGGEEDIIGVNTTSDGKQVFMIVGDSVARGNSSAVGNTPTAGTVFQWDAGNSQVIEVGSGDLLEPVAASAIGSQWPQFGIEYYAATGKKPVFANCAIGGGSFVNTGDASFSWYTNGSLYSNAVTKTNNALAAVGLPKVRAVFCIMGINDTANQSYTLDISYVRSLIDRINTDFDTPKIYLGIPAKNSQTTAQSIRIADMRRFMKTVEILYDNVEIAGNMPNMVSWTGYFQVDDFHLNFDGNTKLGQLLARQVTQNSSYNKYTRTIIGSLFDDISTTRKNLINNFIVSQEASGNLDRLDELHIYKNTTQKNAIIDWGLQSPASLSGATFSADAYISTDGVDDHVSVMSRSITKGRCDYSTDYITGVRIATNNTPAGTAGALFGVREGAAGGLIAAHQASSSQLSYYGTVTSIKNITAGETKFADNSLYCIARNAGNMFFIKNKTIVDTTAQAAVALAPAAGTVLGSILGGRNNNGTIDSRMNAQYVYSFSAKYTTFNLDNFYDNIEILIANW